MCKARGHDLASIQICQEELHTSSAFRSFVLDSIFRRSGVPSPHLWRGRKATRAAQRTERATKHPGSAQPFGWVPPVVTTRSTEFSVTFVFLSATLRALNGCFDFHVFLNRPEHVPKIRFVFRTVIKKHCSLFMLTLVSVVTVSHGACVCWGQSINRDCSEVC